MSTHTRRTLFLATSLALAGWAHPALAQKPKPKPARKAPPAEPAYGRRADIMAFATAVAERRELPLRWLQAQLAQARPQESVRRLIMPPPVATAKNWAAYRARFIEPRRIDAGAAFWRANQAWLSRAQESYGVPPHIVVGIIGVETFYGRVMGNYRVLDALATLSFDFPSGRSDRSPFFRGQLEELLVWCAREGVPATQPMGSYAGAMGLPQFMPGSINQFAVDFDGDGRIDLDRSAADVVGSVARYLADHGWQRNAPTHFDVLPPPPGAQRVELLGPDIKPTFTAMQMADLGAVLSDTGRAHEGALALVELFNGEAPPSYVAGTANFYAVTRYNWSSYYALAVIELGEAVRAALG